MNVILEVIGSIFIIIGVIFCLLGVVGVLRFPDTYSRLHANGMAGTLGIISLCFGVMFIIPSAIPKLLALVLFLIFTNPVVSHAIAASVHRAESRDEDEIISSNAAEQERAYKRRQTASDQVAEPKRSENDNRVDNGSDDDWHTPIVPDLRPD